MAHHCSAFLVAWRQRRLKPSPNADVPGGEEDNSQRAPTATLPLKIILHRQFCNSSSSSNNNSSATVVDTTALEQLLLSLVAVVLVLAGAGGGAGGGGAVAVAVAGLLLLLPRPRSNGRGTYDATRLNKAVRWSPSRYSIFRLGKG